jgi:glycine cleavage system transcriptional repressor
VTTFALSAIGRDRPGIVAAVAGALAADGVNIEDSQMSILRGHFAMVLILKAPPGLDAERLGADLRTVASELELEAIALTPVADASPDAAAEPTHLVSVYGADHLGIVHAVAAGLAAASVNITGLTTRLAGELYVVLLEVAAGDADPAALLAPVAAAQGVEVTVRELETATL